jgi:hypothetical protein
VDDKDIVVDVLDMHVTDDGDEDDDDISLDDDENEMGLVLNGN